jgi:nucleoside-triphosphatase THEP1
MSIVRHVLLTGEPGVGKTTAFLAALHELRSMESPPSVCGFVTAEMRAERGARIGFEIETIPDGLKARLASIATQRAPAGTVGGRGGGGPKVGRYDVHLDAVANVGIPAMVAYRHRARQHQLLGVPSLVAVDEVGKMECLCREFEPAMRRVLDDPDATVLATVALNGRGLIGDVKLRPDVRIVTVTRHNRDDVPATVAMLLRRSLNRSLEQTADDL